MAPDHPGPSRWLRPVWALLLLLSFLTLHYSPVSAVLKGTPAYDANWLQIDANFPLTENALTGQLERFYYARGIYNKQMTINNKTLTEIEGKNINRFHIMLSLWRSDQVCPKYISVSPDDVTSKFDAQSWFSVDRHYTEAEFRAFWLWLKSDCPELLLAFKEMTLSYNTYTTDETVTPPPTVSETVKNLPATLILKEDNSPHIFYDCNDESLDATKVCTFTVLRAPKAQAGVKVDIEFWHSTIGATISGKKSETLADASKASHLSLDPADFDTAGKALVTLTAKDASMIVVQIALGKASATIETPSSQGHAVTKSIVDFLTAVPAGSPKDLLRITSYKKEAIVFDQPTIKQTSCYKLAYIQSDNSHQSYAISAQVKGETYHNAYKLFDLVPTLKAQTEVKFCLQDFLYEPTKVLGSVSSKSAQIQLVLEMEPNPMTPKIVIEQLFAVSLEPDTAATVPNTDPSNSLHFISAASAKRWSTAIPDASIIQAATTTPKVTPQKIEIAASPTPQSTDISSVWVQNHPDLYTGQATVEINLLDAKNKKDALTVKALVCDEIMECATMKVNSRLSTDGAALLYDLSSDAHPNKDENGHVKVVLQVSSPPGFNTKLEIVDFSFGDPCAPVDACGQSIDIPDLQKKECKAVDIRKSRDKTCTCLNPGKTGANCEFDNHCVDATTKAPVTCKIGTCQNNKANTGHVCPCEQKSGQPIELWNTDKCVPQPAFPAPKVDQKTTLWTFDLKDIDPELYDVCVEFKGKLETPAPPPPQATAAPVTPVTGTVKLGFTNTNAKQADQSISWNGDAQKFTITKTDTVYLSVCLGKLLNATWDQNEAKLTVRVDTDQDHTFKDTDSSLTLEVHQPTDPKPMSFVKSDIKRAFTLPDASLVIGPTTNGKQTITFADKASAIPVDTRFVLYSDWIQVHKNLDKLSNQIDLTDESTDKSFLSSKIELCPPRAAGNCEPFDSSSLASQLAIWKSDRLQLRLTIDALKDIPIGTAATLKLDLTVSLWDACHTVQCVGTNVVCEASSTLDDFKCIEKGQKVCPKGYTGKLCQIKESDFCNSAAEADCATVGGTCVALEGDYTCKCPEGSDYEKATKTCHRKKVKYEEKKCTPDDSANCFLTNLDAPFVALPKNFPKIDRKASKSLYYAFQGESRMTLQVEDTAKELASPDKDVCLRFKYFVSPGASLHLRLNELQLLTIDGFVPLSDEAKTNNQRHQVALSEPTTICLKGLLPETHATLDAFTLEFIAQINSEESAVAIELIEESPGTLLKVSNKVPFPEAPLKYLTRTNSELPAVTDKAILEQGVTYQWPVQFPTNELKQWTPVTGKLCCLSFNGHGSNVIQTAILESTWLDRKVFSFTDLPIFLNFKLAINSKLNLPDDTHFNLEIRLLNQARQVVRTVGPSGTPGTFGPKEITDAKGEFVIRFIPERDLTLYKLQFVVKYYDDASPSLFTLTDLSFGDPCLNHIHDDETIDVHKVASKPPKLHPRICYGTKGGIIQLGKNDKGDLLVCERKTSTEGQVDYQCPCMANSGMSGKDCSTINYCSFTHKFTVPDKVVPTTPKSVTESGTNYCSVDPKKPLADCLPIKYNTGKFVCKCAANDMKFDMTQRKCVPIEACILNPCAFATETCKENATSPLGRDCTPIVTHDDLECDPNTAATCGPNQTCLRKFTDKEQHVCKCNRGFTSKKDSAQKIVCVSDMCNFEGRSACPHTCQPDDTVAPFYKCTCAPGYKAGVKPDGSHECVWEATASAPTCDCTGPYELCSQSGKCDACVEDFQRDTTTNTCVPKGTFKLAACPTGVYKLNDAKQYVCDCAGNSTQASFFTEDLAAPSTCKLTSTICDAGQTGRSVCEKRDAGCLVNPSSIDDYSCQCQLGRLFPDGLRLKKATDLFGQPKSGCLSVCDLPYMEQKCASVGGTCNQMKLWSSISIGWPMPDQQALVNDIDTAAYCDCVPGTFFQQDSTGVSSCAQEVEAAKVNITLRWSHQLQDFYQKALSAAVEVSQEPLEASTATGLEYFAPVEQYRRQIAVLEENRKAEATIRARLEESLKLELVRSAIGDLLYNFNVITRASGAGDMEKQKKENLELISGPVPDEKGNYVLKLAVKISQEIKDKQAAAAQGGSFEEAAGETLSYDLLPTYTVIKDSCHPIKDSPDNCIIPYMDLVLGVGNITPDILKPCEDGQACHGMSNCQAQPGSQFSCTCGAELFAVESESTFKTADKEIVYANQRCKTVTGLCPTKCKEANTKCIEHDPILKSNVWSKDFECPCVDKYIAHAHGNGTRCTSVCEIKDCILANGHCDDSQGPAVCTCKEDFYGPRCEHEHSSNTGWIVAVVVLGVLTVAGIGAAAFFFMKSPKTSTHAHPPRPSPTTPLSPVRKVANIRRIGAKADLHNLELNSGPVPEPKSKFPNLDQNNNQHHETYEIQQTQSLNLKAASILGLAGPPEPGQTRLREHAHARSVPLSEEKLSQHSAGSFISADVASFDFSRQASVSSLTVHEPFTPFNASPRTLYSRKSVVLATIASMNDENEPKTGEITQRSSNSDRSSSRSSSSSSVQAPEVPLASVKEEERPRRPEPGQPEAEEPRKPEKGPPEPAQGQPEAEGPRKQTQSPSEAPQGPGEVRFTEPDETISNRSSRKSSSSSSDNSEPETVGQDPPEPGSLTLTRDPTLPSERPVSQGNLVPNLLRDSQEMNADKFEAVRSRIAAVLRLTKHQSYELR